MITIHDWLCTYEDLPPVGISSNMSVEGVCKKARGARFLFAVVRLGFSPFDKLQFTSSLPHEDYMVANKEQWLHSIALGVLDVMLVHPAKPITHFLCVIESIKFHKVDSSKEAFRLAGRYAAQELLKSEKFASM